MRELEKLLKDLNLAIAKIKDIDCKVKDKIDKVSGKALMAKMPETPKTTIERLLNVQKTVIEGQQFKYFALSARPPNQARTKDTELPAQLLVPRMANPVEVTGKEETCKENIDDEICRVLVPFIPPTFYANYANHELEDRIHRSFPMTRDTLAGLTHAKGASEWTVTAYKDAQLVRLDLVSLSGVYCVNSIELVWDVPTMLLFKNIPEMGQAHAAACFCFPVEHTLSYLLESFGHA
ncbi:hypothetical protein DSO57_1036617, partial [Entomophthora muscae]